MKYAFEQMLQQYTWWCWDASYNMRYVTLKL